MMRFALIASVASAAKPIVELSLGAPAHAHGAVADAISAAEKGSAGSFVNDMASLDAEYSKVLSKASVALGSTIAKALGRASFANIVEPTISVKVVSAKSDEAAGAGAVKSIESKRGAAESALIASARSEFEELAKVVIGEFDKQIRAHKTSFLGFSREINVRLVADPNYPSVSNMLMDFQSRRDTAESAIRAKILTLEMSLVKALNKIGATALGAH